VFVPWSTSLCGMPLSHSGKWTPDQGRGLCWNLSKRWRLRHFGTELFRRLHDSLTAAEGAVVILGETRTSHPGGWKVVRHSGFIPLGFEPFAHRTPIGSESMLMTGRILPSALAKRNIDSVTSPRVHKLSLPVLKQLQFKPLSLEDSGNIYGLSEKIPTIQLKLLEDIEWFSTPNMSSGEYVIKVYHDNTLETPPEKLKNLDPHKASIISLQRLEGEDFRGIRYEHLYFQAYVNNHPIAYAVALWDHVDCRLRILSLRAIFDGLQGLMIQQILQKVVHQIEGNPLIVVVDVRADNVKLHSTLEKLGFFPTIYYPALIAEGECRVDGVQFTRLYNLDFEKSWSPADFREWPVAASVASQVSGVCRDSWQSWPPTKGGHSQGKFAVHREPDPPHG
jgi:hypothetical protein